jgi:TetR/AcrR family transcriptional regulator
MNSLMPRPPETAAPIPDGARARILAAALVVFAERGFDGARTREIAERAGANLGLIKYYFNDKEKLWKAAVAQAFAELQAGLTSGAPPGSGDDEFVWLGQVVRQFVRFVARHPEFMRLMNDEAKRDSKRMRWLADRFVRPMSQALGAHIERAQAQGLWAAIPPVSLRYIVLGAAGLIFSQAPECKYIEGIDPTDPRFAARHADALVELLTAGSKRSRSAQPGRRRFVSKRRRQERIRTTKR